MPKDLESRIDTLEKAISTLLKERRMISHQVPKFHQWEPIYKRFFAIPRIIEDITDQLSELKDELYARAD